MAIIVGSLGPGLLGCMDRGPLLPVLFAELSTDQGFLPLFLAFDLFQEEGFNKYHRLSATLSLEPATLEVFYIQGSPLVETDQTLAHLSSL